MHNFASVGPAAGTHQLACGQKAGYRGAAPAAQWRSSCTDQTRRDEDQQPDILDSLNRVPQGMRHSPELPGPAALASRQGVPPGAQAPPWRGTLRSTRPPRAAPPAAPSRSGPLLSIAQ